MKNQNDTSKNTADSADNAGNAISETSVGNEASLDSGEPSIASENKEEDEEQAPTPFDHPLFLPVLLSGLALWFGYDGFLNQDESMLEHVTFNRVGFGVLLIGAIYTGINGYKEWKEIQREE